MTYTHLLLLAALLPAFAVGCKRTDASEALPPATGSGAAPLPTPPKLDTAESESSTAETQALRATGSTLAIKQAELGPKASGVLASVLVEEGDRVRKGQALFRLDGTASFLAVRQTEAALAQAKVSLSRAELEYSRMKPLIDQGAVSPANWDAVRIGQDQARVGVQQAEAAVASARAYANDTTVVAPFAGVIAAKKKNAGETVTMMPPTTIVVLQDISKLEIRVKIAENSLNRVKAGAPMVVKFGSLGLEKTVAIDRVNPSVDPFSRTVEVIGILANEERTLKAGMLVDVTFPTTSVPVATAPSSVAPTKNGAVAATVPSHSTSRQP